MNIDQQIVKIIEDVGVDIVCSVPCNLLGSVMGLLDACQVRHVPVTREEEGGTRPPGFHSRRTAGVVPPSHLRGGGRDFPAVTPGGGGTEIAGSLRSQGPFTPVWVRQGTGWRGPRPGGERSSLPRCDFLGESKTKALDPRIVPSDPGGGR